MGGRSRSARAKMTANKGLPTGVGSSCLRPSVKTVVNAWIGGFCFGLVILWLLSFHQHHSSQQHYYCWILCGALRMMWLTFQGPLEEETLRWASWCLIAWMAEGGCAHTLPLGDALTDLCCGQWQLCFIGAASGYWWGQARHHRISCWKLIKKRSLDCIVLTPFIL